MSKLFVLTLFSILFSNYDATAQIGKEAWHWQFGYHQAINFDTGVPITDTGLFIAGEGNATISDRNTGELLFATNSTEVYDKTGQIMPNGTGLFWTLFHNSSSVNNS
ncbi:MAG: hypothetical protein IPG89_17555 [Bacteroidetes bacterium]|nr:hypothetical protein [Bacteroidota bacterium]